MVVYCSECGRKLSKFNEQEGKTICFACFYKKWKEENPDIIQQLNNYHNSLKT